MQSHKRYVSAQLLSLLLQYLEDQPEALRALLDKTGLRPDGEFDPHTRISVDAVCETVSALSSRLNLQNGLRLAQRPGPYRNNTLLMSILSHCGTLDKAVEKLAQYHDIASDSIRLRLRRGADGAALEWQADLPLDRQTERIFVEAAVAASVEMFRELTAGQARPACVRFAYPAPPDPAEYESFFRCPVLFEREQTSVTLDFSTLRLPIAMSDANLLSVLEEYAGALLRDVNGELRDQVYKFIRESILRGQDTSAGTAARRFAMSVRTLQSRLHAEGASYRGLLESAKKDIAIQALRQGKLPLYDIAFLLGYSEQSAFNHAYKRWTGQSPRQSLKRR